LWVLRRRRRNGLDGAAKSRKNLLPAASGPFNSPSERRRALPLTRWRIGATRISGGRIAWVACRVRSLSSPAGAAGSVPDDVRKAVQRCASEWGRLDILVNNAGVTSPGAVNLVDVPITEWDRVMSVNLTGALVCIQAAAPAIRDAGGGSVINMTSISARSCYPGTGAYGVSKAALEAFTRLAALELAPWRIRVNSMSLGWFRTALNEHVYQRPGELARRNATIPFGRIGTIEDCAKLALFLASDDSSYVTGESIESDGGLLTAALKSTFDLATIRPTPQGA
jgi:NAD(P)-dependent dehydrogenase (short-subunit alcohol dehydrogenase family)